MPDHASKSLAKHTPRTVLHRVGEVCRKAPGKLADFILPPLCLVCRSSVMGQTGLCSQCWSKIDFIEPPTFQQHRPQPTGGGQYVVLSSA